MTCRERFRLATLIGIKEGGDFNQSLEYGNLWHEMEEALAGNKDWKEAAKAYQKKLQLQYPENRADIVKWYYIAMVQFPIYVNYWKNHPDVKKRKPIYQEAEFKVPYKLPSGRTVLMRGKWDAVDYIGKEIYIQENKAKGDFSEERLLQELNFSVQPMMYMIALKQHFLQIKEPLMSKQVRGIRYNVIRRPLADWRGRYNVKQRKGREVLKKDKDGNQVLDAKGNKVKERVGVETDIEYYKRIGEVIKSDLPHFFFRSKVVVTNSDLRKFKEQFFHSQLEQICDWWDWITSPEGIKNPFDNPVHYRCPYGGYNPMMMGRPDKYGHFLDTGIPKGLMKATRMFPELSED